MRKKLKSFGAILYSPPLDVPVLSQKMNYLQRLPVDCLRFICSFLRERDILAFHCTSMHFRRLFQPHLKKLRTRQYLTCVKYKSILKRILTPCSYFHSTKVVRLLRVGARTLLYYYHQQDLQKYTHEYVKDICALRALLRRRDRIPPQNFRSFMSQSYAFSLDDPFISYMIALDPMNYTRLLPVDCVRYLFGFLREKDIFAFHLTCMHWRTTFKKEITERREKLYLTAVEAKKKCFSSLIEIDYTYWNTSNYLTQLHPQLHLSWVGGLKHRIDPQLRLIPARIVEGAVFSPVPIIMNIMTTEETNTPASLLRLMLSRKHAISLDHPLLCYIIGLVGDREIAAGRIPV